MLADSSKENYAQSLKAFFQDEPAEPPRGKKSLAEAKRATEDRMRALDHGLQAGLGMSLSRFRVAEPCAPLTSKQRRYFVHISALPPEVQSVACGRSRRACLWDSAREVGRLEVLWSADGRVLHDASDMGPSNWASQYFLFCRQPIRGYMWFDLPHRRHDLGSDGACPGG